MNNRGKTLVIGASDNPKRYSYMAVNMLLEYGYPVVAIGGRQEQVAGISFGKKKEKFEDVDTITIYLNPLHQAEYYNYVVGLKPRRVVFNPGAENPEFARLLQKADIEVLEACTLVLLRTGQY